MLQETAQRISGKEFAAPIIVGAEAHRFFIKRQLQEAGTAVETILLEPAGRNTSTAAALAAEWLRSTGRDEILLLMPSDHVIGDCDTFRASIKIGIPHAEDGAIVTFGVVPSEPNTEYGYIEVDRVQDQAAEVYPVVRFVEKPDSETAIQYVQSGRFFWNSGIFLVKATTLLDEMRRFLPKSLDAISRSVAHATSDGIFVRPEAGAFEDAENISIDYGIMEKTSRGVVVPVEMDWSDVGSWAAVWKLCPKDANNNVAQGDVLSIDTRDSLFRSDGSAVIAAIGLEKMAVIVVRDAVFVAPLDRVADVKQLVARLQEQGRDCAILPSKVARPWGSYETVHRGSRFQIKHIVVDPGESLSLQLHYQRSEHWVVVRGTAEVTVGDTVSILQENQSTYISPGTKHRLSNPGKVPLELVEVQCGPYLGEDDIVRFSDEYGRS